MKKGQDERSEIDKNDEKQSLNGYCIKCEKAEKVIKVEMLGERNQCESRLM